MSHRYKKGPPSTKIYRHFAAITLFLTLLIAIFADGESSEAVASPDQGQYEERVAKEDNTDEARAAIQQPGGVWGSDAPIQPAASLVPTSMTQSYGTSNGAVLTQGGLSSEQLSQLSPGEREALKQTSTENPSDPAYLRSQAASLEAASRRRSGSVGRD